jgi:hypothetical protein
MFGGYYPMYYQQPVYYPGPMYNPMVAQQQYLSYMQALNNMQFNYMTSQSQIRQCWNGVCNQAQEVAPSERRKFKSQAKDFIMDNVAPAMFDYAMNYLNGQGGF